jgi:thioredoxin 1
MLAMYLEDAEIDLPIDVIDIDENQQLATKYSVRSVPTLVLIEDEVEINRSIGLKNTKELEAWVNGQAEYQK